MGNVLRDRKQPLVRMDVEDKDILDKLANQTGESHPKLLHRAVTQLKKEIFFEKMITGYQALRQNKAYWEEELNERSLFDKASGDGLCE